MLRVNKVNNKSIVYIKTDILPSTNMMATGTGQPKYQF